MKVIFQRNYLSSFAKEFNFSLQGSLYFCSMEWTASAASLYAEKYTTKAPVLLNELEKHTQAHKHQHLMCSPAQGRLLSLISSLVQPRYILEIGSFTGYSALCLAEGLQAGGVLHTIEKRAEDANLAQTYFDQSEYKDNIHLHLGEALDIIPTLKIKEWNLIFLDADKTGYLTYYNLLLPKLAKNGLIIVDNVLFHGEVLATEIKGKNAKAIHQFNEFVATDERTEQIVLTIRDGLMLIKKL